MTSNKQGFYLNNSKPISLYKDAINSYYFVDKSDFIAQIIPQINALGKYVCITRPRRFGKSTVASMLGAFFGKGFDSKDIFDKLLISKFSEYGKHINQYNVIYIDFSLKPDDCKSFEAYIEKIKKTLQKDVRRYFDDVEFETDSTLEEDLKWVNFHTGEKFIFILDEWDSVFQFDITTKDDKKRYLSFLKVLLKGNAYVAFAYMTGVMPISKHSSGSELNMFLEYSMSDMEKYSDYFGFTDEEVDNLYKKYIAKLSSEAIISREELRQWYDGYYTKGNAKIYNPQSIVFALINNQISNYWTNSGPYDEIFYYIKNNVEDITDDIARLVAGESIAADVKQYAAGSPHPETKDEIISAMVVFGFLTVFEKAVSIPNKELMEKFTDTIKSRKELGYVYRLAKESKRLLQATLLGDTETMEQIFESAHDTETPLLAYNREEELSSLIRFMYLSARDEYITEREDRAGKGFVDYIFYPKKKQDTAIIMEFKVNDTAQNAIEQIKNKNYADKFLGKLGEKPEYTGKILAVGISYNKKDKKHSCIVEAI